MQFITVFRIKHWKQNGILRQKLPIFILVDCVRFQYVREDHIVSDEKTTTTIVLFFSFQVVLVFLLSIASLIIYFIDAST